MATTFDASYYLSNNPDVLTAILSGAFSSAEQHYQMFGEKEGRMPNPFFNPSFYYAQNPDVLSAVLSGAFPTALDHYEMFGEAEGRAFADGQVFNEAAYLAANPDVAAAVTDGTFSSGYEHFVLFGAEEGRTGSGTTGGTGSTFNLTVNQDSGTAFTGTAGSDTFVAAAAQDGNGILINTLQSVDALDGGAGTDTLSATLAEVRTVSPTLKNIESINVRFADAGAVLDLANATGVTGITVADSTTAGKVASVGAVDTLTVKNTTSLTQFDGSTATTLKVTLDTVGKSTGNATVDLGAATAAKATTGAFTLNNAYVDLNSTIADALTTLTVAATGTNKLSLVDSGNDLTSVTVTGAGSLDLSATALNGALTKFDASASTGAIKADIQSTKAVTVTTGSGADVIDMDTAVIAKSSVALGSGNDSLYAGAQLANFDAGVNGGDGTDIINITDGATLTSTTAKYISNFETLDVSGGKGSYDVSLNSFATVQIDEAVNGALTGDVTFANTADAFTLNVASKADGTDFDVVKNTIVTLKDAAGTTAAGTAESFTLVATLNDGDKDNGADGNINAQTITVAGVENLIVKASVGTVDGGTTAVASSAYTLTANLVAAAAETLTISGDASVDLSAATTIGVLTKVDASASTGNVTIDLSTHAKSVAYTGSAGVDTYTASTLGDTIYTGKGADVVTLTAGVRDTFVLKAATDSQVTDTSKDGKITLAADTGFDTVNALTAGAAATDDRIDLTNFGFSGAQRGVVDVTAKVTGTTDLTSITDLFNDPAGDRGVAYSTIGADSFVFVDVNKDGDFTAAADLVVKLVAVASISETTINF